MILALILRKAHIILSVSFHWTGQYLVIGRTATNRNNPVWAGQLWFSPLMFTKLLMLPSDLVFVSLSPNFDPKDYGWGKPIFIAQVPLLFLEIHLGQKKKRGEQPSSDVESSLELLWFVKTFSPICLCGLVR